MDASYRLKSQEEIVVKQFYDGNGQKFYNYVNICFPFMNDNFHDISNMPRGTHNSLGG